MGTASTLGIIVICIIAFVLLIYIFRSFYTVRQAEVAVITRFGKFLKISTAGLNFKNPIIDGIYSIVSLQNQTEEVNFNAVTSDQANVQFATMILYSVSDSELETIKKVAFKFTTAKDFILALTKTIEGNIRSYISTRKQAEILQIKSEIVDHVKEQLKESLSDWGYQLIDLQITDISFDKVITDSMAKVVASANLRAAAENEGAALLITKTKQAEAEAQFITISAKAEADANKLKGEGVANYRKAMAEGLKESLDSLGKDTQTAEIMIMLSMWTEMITRAVEAGKDNMIILDASAGGFQSSVNKLIGIDKMDIKGVVN